jgi:hypothetical protein
MGRRQTTMKFNSQQQQRMTAIWREWLPIERLSIINFGKMPDAVDMASKIYS